MLTPQGAPTRWRPERRFSEQFSLVVKLKMGVKRTYGHGSLPFILIFSIENTSLFLNGVVLMFRDFFFFLTLGDRMKSIRDLNFSFRK